MQPQGASRIRLTTEFGFTRDSRIDPLTITDPASSLMEHKRLMETGMCRLVLMNERVGLTCSSHGRALERCINEVLVMEKLMVKGERVGLCQSPQRDRDSHMKGRLLGIYM